MSGAFAIAALLVDHVRMPGSSKPSVLSRAGEQLERDTVEYWQTAGLSGYRGGPFADRSGGLILFQASTLEDAVKTAAQDPFVVRNLLTQRWVKEWLPE